MSTATFGDVTYSEQPGQDASAANGQHVEIIDPNDPRLTSEVLTVNPEGDAYAIPPPLPDGKWRAKAKQVDIKDDKGQMQRSAAFSRAKMNGGNPFLATNVEFTVLDSSGKFDGTKLTEYWVKTLVEQRSGTSQIASLLAKLGKPLASGTQGDYMKKFLEVLAGEPELVIETAWEASCQSCQEAAKKTGAKAPKPFLVGMHRFPQTKAGPDPIVQCPNCKSQVRAQPRIANFFPLSTPHNP